MTRSRTDSMYDLSLIPSDTDDRLRLFNRLVTYAVDQASEENLKFCQNTQYIIQNALTDEDKRALRLDNRPTLNYPILKAYVMRSLKNVIDSSPTLSVYSAEDDSIDPFYQIPAVKIAEILNITLKEILDQNQYKHVLFGVAFDCFVGNKGIFKIRTDYRNQYNFQQKFVIECINDPTMVFFDPRAKHITGADGEYTGELCMMTKEAFQCKYPKVNWDDVIRQNENYNLRMGTGYKFEWFKKEKNSVVIADFYYKKYKVKKLYQLNNNTIIERKLTEEEKNTGLQVMSKRDAHFVEIWHTQFCGDIELKKPELTNFHHLIHVKCPGEIAWENGKPTFLPVAKPAFDAQRTKNFLLNFFLFDTLNHDKGKMFIPEESVTDQDDLNMRHPQDENIVYYKQYMTSPNDGQLIPLNTPHYVPPPPIDNAPVEAAQVMNEDIEKILGLQFPSMDETNLSGKALYNMADFMSASNEMFMQHLMEAWRQVGCIILDAMPNVLSPRNIGMVPPGQNPNYESSQVTQQFQYHYNFMRGFYQVDITRGVNYKLQQQKNVEMLLKFGELYPPLTQFLFTDGFDFMLANMDFNDKEKLEEAYQNYQQKIQKQAMQSGAQQMQQMEMQQKQQQIQTQAANAQAHLMKAQTEQQRLQLDSQQLQHQKNETQTNALIELQKLNSSEKKNYLDNLVKLTHIQSTNMHQRTKEGARA